MKLRILLLFLIFFYQLKAQYTTIIGSAKSYANRQAEVFVYDDFITETRKILGIINFDTAGTFKITVPLQDTQKIYIDLETTYGFLYAYPNDTFIVLLPKYQALKLEQVLSPYFKPKRIRLFIINQDTNSLNFVIAKFDAKVADLLSKLQFLITSNPKKIDTLIQQIDKNFKYNQWLFFKNYKKYTLALIKLTYQNNPEKIFNIYLKNSEIDWNNPAYFRLFNTIFDNFFDPLQSFKNITPALKALKTKNLNSITDSVQKIFNYEITAQLAQLITLKALYDLFYSAPQSIQNLIIATLQNPTNIYKSPQLQKLAKNIYADITRLMVGYPAPNFSLPNKLGIKRNLSDFQGKFVYLNFCNPITLACKEQLPMLQKYAQSAPKDFQIITLIYGLDKKQFRQFTKTYKSPNWTFLYANDQKKLLKTYKVVAFPTYYLIAPDGTLLLNPAPTPLENFEQIFASIYKNWHLKHRQQQTTAIRSD